MGQGRPVDALGRRQRIPGEAPQAWRLDQTVHEDTLDICRYIEAETGYDIDPRSVHLFRNMYRSWLKSEGGQRASDRHDAKARAEAARINKKHPDYIDPEEI